MLAKLIFIAVTVILNVPYSNAGSSRIVGGTEVPFTSRTYQVSLQNVSEHHVCGGVVISGRHILTAAHCVFGAHPQYITAVVGTTDLDVGGNEYDILSIKIHKEYNATLRTNDIAILKIKGLFDLKYVEIIKFYNNKLVEGDSVILTGFGAQEPNGASSRVLKTLTLPVFNQEVCIFAMRYSRNVTERMFCTFTQIGEGSCHGDSGGPLTKDNQLVGIVSWGIPCAVGFPDVHTRITPYIDWIRQETKHANCHYKKKHLLNSILS